MRDKSITGDGTTVIFDGKSPDRLACDTTLRCMPDGSWMMVMLGQRTSARESGIYHPQCGSGKHLVRYGATRLGDKI